jgi:FkbM family methyltransferase
MNTLLEPAPITPEAALRAEPLKVAGDYQQYELDASGCIQWCGDRMNAKLVSLRDIGVVETFCQGKSVLDIGCDMGFWSFLASTAGARMVLGLDRNRNVRGLGHTDLVAGNTHTARRYPMHDRVFFREINLGKQWHELGRFDIVFCMSVYHHIFAQCESHKSVWFWLARHTMPGGTLIWESPLDERDIVIQKDVPRSLHRLYTRQAITEAFEPYFELVGGGPALHETTREVLVLRRKPQVLTGSRIDEFQLKDGAGGATRAFQRDAGRRTKEIEDALGVRPFPGSLNVTLPGPFDWEREYYRVQIQDSTNRKDPMAPWAPRWCRFYPLALSDVGGWAMRFEDEWYAPEFMEVIAPHHLRSIVEDPAHPHEASQPEVEPGIYEVDGQWWPRGSAEVRPTLLHEVKILGQVLDCLPGRDWRVALQAGGHVGIYPLHLFKLGFKLVITFEPNHTNYSCLAHNCREFLADGRLQAVPRALGYGPGQMTMRHEAANSGAHHLTGDLLPVIPGAAVRTPTVGVMTIDSLDLPVLDFICLDVEGYEHNVLSGANATIQRCKPLIMCEDKGLSERYGTKRGELARMIEDNFGYQMLAHTQHDIIMGPKA